MTRKSVGRIGGCARQGVKKSVAPRAHARGRSRGHEIVIELTHPDPLLRGDTRDGAKLGDQSVWIGFISACTYCPGVLRPSSTVGVCDEIDIARSPLDSEMAAGRNHPQ